MLYERLGFILISHWRKLYSVYLWNIRSGKIQKSFKPMLKSVLHGLLIWYQICMRFSHFSPLTPPLNFRHPFYSILRCQPKLTCTVENLVIVSAQPRVRLRDFTTIASWNHATLHEDESIISFSTVPWSKCTWCKTSELAYSWSKSCNIFKAKTTRCFCSNFPVRQGMTQWGVIRR